MPGGATLPRGERVDGADVPRTLVVWYDNSGEEHIRLETIFARYHFAWCIRWAVGYGCGPVVVLMVVAQLECID